MKRLVLLFLLLSATSSSAQQFDTIISTAAYQSYFNSAKHEPVIVVYKLFHGGGDCDRSKFHFKNDTGLPTAKPVDYAGNGYDEGHMANAEDFASDCTLDELTFRFYNCVPQTPNLNRGVYKVWETKIRSESQSDSLLIVCGNIFGTMTIGQDKIAVPDSCFKVVESLSTHTVMHVLMFSNTSTASVEEETLDQLQKTLGYTIPLVLSAVVAPSSLVGSSPEVVKSAESPGQCQAYTKQGKRCSRMAQAGSIYCWQHQK